MYDPLTGEDPYQSAKSFIIGLLAGITIGLIVSAIFW
jgi:uncharacterized membrane protein YccC